MIARFRSRGSAAGNIITLLLLVGIIGLGVYLWLGKGAKESSTAGTPASTTTSAANNETDGDAPAPIEPVEGTPPLEAAATYTPKDGVLQIDISEYAGYGGLIVANGGLEPNPDSFFAKEYGFKVRISMSESETWSPLNNGRLAATAPAIAALAVLGREFEAVVPVQIGRIHVPPALPCGPRSQPQSRSQWSRTVQHDKRRGGAPPWRYCSS